VEQFLHDRWKVNVRELLIQAVSKIRKPFLQSAMRSSEIYVRTISNANGPIAFQNWDLKSFNYPHNTSRIIAQSKTVVVSLI